jgi:hypothetical protein
MSNKKVMSLTEIENIERRLYANYAREACVKKQKAPRKAKATRKVKTVARETSFTLRSPDARRRAAAKRRRQVEAQYRAPNGQFATVDDLKLGLLVSAPLPPFRPYSWRNY